MTKEMIKIITGCVLLQEIIETNECDLTENEAKVIRNLKKEIDFFSKFHKNLTSE